MALITLGLCLSAQSPTSLPGRVSDYRAFLAAQQLAAESKHAQVVEALKPVWNFQPLSPLLGKAAILAATSYEELGQHADALQTLRDYSERLPQPEGWLLLGRNAEGGERHRRSRRVLPAGVLQLSALERVGRGGSRAGSAEDRAG